MKKFSEMAKDDILLAGEKMYHASMELGIENPLEKHVCQKAQSIRKKLKLTL